MKVEVRISVRVRVEIRFRLLCSTGKSEAVPDTPPYIFMHAIKAPVSLKLSRCFLFPITLIRVRFSCVRIDVRVKERVWVMVRIGADLPS